MAFFSFYELELISALISLPRFTRNLKALKTTKSNVIKLKKHDKMQ